MKPLNATADPGLIGLLGFVLATVTAQLEHLGVQDVSPVFWIGAIFGGVVQVTAGMLSYFNGDDFHFLLYNAFGWFWIVVPGFLLGDVIGFFEVSGSDRGAFILIFAILALLLAPVGATHNSVLPVTLLSTAVGLGLQSAGAFFGAVALTLVGAVVLLAVAAMAAYMLIEKLYWLTLGRHLLPLGPPWICRSTDIES